MRKAERLFEIVQLLRLSRAPISAQHIAGELGSSKRSVYRDIAALKAQDVPIRGEAGVGYVLEKGFDMPPLMLTSDELDAAVLGASWVASRGEPDLAKAALNLLAKIEVVVPERLRAHVLEPATSIAPVVPAIEVVDSSSLRNAIRRHRKITLVYDGGSGVRTERVVWPILLGYRDTGRILAAWCELRSGFRYFRTDRMISAETLEQPIPENALALRARWRSAMDQERASYARQPQEDR
ncbi:YafY family protein [uncultured Litoreibacter sp.]|uniref:helix-turn-helix transcriptional regulator n=1 Tax=uncultured Litoreibacter sp. TaxID=1392394 RepID=UPI00261A2B44|nr:YafY family protein [uncultured Litoreibacter sp.]